MHGQVILNKEGIKTVRSWDKMIFPREKSVFDFPAGTGPFSGIHSPYRSWSASKFVEKIAYMAFKCNELDDLSSFACINMEAFNVNRVHDKLKFSLKRDVKASSIYSTNFQKNGKTLPASEKQSHIVQHITKNYSANFLKNGLTQTVTDEYNQQVRLITRASFPTENYAHITIINKRTPEDKPYNILSFNVQNKEHASWKGEKHHSVTLDKDTLKTTIDIHAGNILFFGLKKLGYSSVFIKPGDKLTLEITDTTCRVIDNPDNEWWQEHKGSLSKNMVEQAPISPEFKSYLKLKIVADDTHNKLQYQSMGKMSLPDFNLLISPYYYLKSYHYDWASNLFNLHTIFMDAENYLRNQISRKSNFDFDNMEDILEDMQTNQHNIFFYRNAFSEARSSFAYEYILETGNPFTKLLSQCGDEALNNRLKERIKEIKLFKEGNKLQFTTLNSDSSENINILPPRGRYILFYLSVSENVSGCRNIARKLNEKVDVYTYSIIPEGEKDSTGLIKKQLYSPKSPTKGNPHTFELIAADALILIDHKGEIIYNKSLNIRYKGRKSYQTHADQINARIEKRLAYRRLRAMQITISILVVLASLALIWLVVYRIRLYTSKRNQMIQELKLKSVQSQLNPHFLFNALNSIQTLVITNKNEEANHYLVRFSNLLRGVLKNSDKRLVSLSEELELIEEYCDLEKLRLPFSCKIILADDVKPDLLEVPYMLLQPIIENALKHGLSKIEEPRTLALDIKLENDTLLFSIKNNGPAFVDCNIEHLMEKGKGLKLSLEKILSIYDDAELWMENQTNLAIVNIKFKIR